LLNTATLPIAVKAAEISAAGQSIFAYDKGSKVAQAYAEFTKEVLTDGERVKAKSAVSR
jgi:chromosome partitioning protein